jgi:4-deoxy-L-threo-5-hexosulose-uronate ketol-isomerase
VKTKYTTDNIRYKRMTTDELREAFLVQDLFDAGSVALTYSEVDRAVIGSAVPLSSSLELQATKATLAANHFCERREVGILNIGGKGTITVDGAAHELDALDCLYIGRGSKDIQMSSEDAQFPAKYYILSYPAHADYPTVLVKQADANAVHLGSSATCNERTIYQYIHAGGAQSCQLVMGFTLLKEGSVWNTFPCHTHQRRSEVYMYFNLAPDSIVFHMMGEPQETRHLVMHEGDAVVSPIWSIHSGAGTGSYCFCWGMGGENQAFDDMDHVAVGDVR